MADENDAIATLSSIREGAPESERQVVRIPYRRVQPTANDEVFTPQFMSAAQSAFQSLPMADAERAVSAAIQFQGMRGYQRELQSGKPAEEAMAKWGPLMFYSRPTAFGPSISAIQRPKITPYQQQTLDLRRLEQNAPKVHVAGGGIYRTTPDGKVETLVAPRKVNNPTEYETITEELPETGDVPAVPAQEFKPKRTIVGIPIPFTGQEARPAQPAIAAHGKQRITRRVPLNKSASAAPTAPTAPAETATEDFGTEGDSEDQGTPVAPSSPAAPAAKPVAEVIRKTKDGKRAVFDANTKKFIRYAD